MIPTKFSVSINHETYFAFDHGYIYCIRKDAQTPLSRHVNLMAVACHGYGLRQTSLIPRWSKHYQTDKKIALKMSLNGVTLFDLKTYLQFRQTLWVTSPILKYSNAIGEIYTHILYRLAAWFVSCFNKNCLVIIPLSVKWRLYICGWVLSRYSL